MAIPVNQLELYPEEYIIEEDHKEMGQSNPHKHPSEMKREAVTAGFYHSPGWKKDYPKIQLLTVEELLNGRGGVNMPPTFTTFKQAQRVGQPSATQSEFDLPD